MKHILICSLSGLFILPQCHSQMDTTNFKSERISKTADIVIKQKIGIAFPLFGPFEERKWAEGWNPRIVYPSTEITAEGTAFKTPGHTMDEPELLWIVSKYEPEKFLIQYLVLAADRFLTITV